MGIIKKLKNDKAVGFDLISNEMLISSPKDILMLIFKFTNLCLSKTLVPEAWCRDLINPIFKEGSMDDPNNYRGICISSALLKIITSLLSNRIQNYCKESDIINKNQIGFKNNHRTSDHLLTLKAVVNKYVTQGKNKLFTCFVDFKKAFDSVWHQGMFHKLNKIGINGKLLDLIKNIYSKTKCAVKVNNNITDFFKYTKGVRQGCPLSPILFNIYINDLFERLNNNNKSDIILDRDHKVNALMYADDVILLSDTKEGLQEQIDKISHFCTEWKLDVNIKKTKIMIFNRGNKWIKSNFYIKDKLLENVKTFKYLGFTISANQCSFVPTINDLSTKANRAIYALNNKIKISILPARLAVKIFESQITPILLYGSEVWGPYVAHDYITWDKSATERVHVQFLKRVLGCNFSTSNNMTRAEIGARPLLIHIINRVISYTANIKGRKSSIAHIAYEYEDKDNTGPNFCKYLQKFDLNLHELVAISKWKNKKTCKDNYDRFWRKSIGESPKALSFVTFKGSIYFEKYLHVIKNIRHKKSLSRFRLSNHSLMIEKGRHMRPRLERTDRKCFTCKDEVEDETHFLIKCPLYRENREILFAVCQNNCIHFNSMTTDKQKFIFLMTNENIEVINNLAAFIFKATKIRDRVIS